MRIRFSFCVYLIKEAKCYWLGHPFIFPPFNEELFFQCPKNEPTFFDPDCEGCMEILSKYVQC